MHKQKITIEYKYRGSIEFPDTKDAKNIFFKTKQAYANHEKMGINLIFSNAHLKRLHSYTKGGAADELANLDFYIELGAILGFDVGDAEELRKSILLINDNAHSKFNITKRLRLINKKKKTQTKDAYLFWDIENFSNISSIFNDIIEPFEIQDHNIHLAANPDSLYLKRAEWEANLYDYSKTLNSFNFIKCDHGKNVADDVLLEEFKKLRVKNSDVYILTFDRELKERFLEMTHQSNNLFIMEN
ncbi:hypothetical protein KJ877_05395 [bacterium]|nr:hypothetical protein [bacterium]MBU1990466.1 hypothetical protein [bacterium]